MFGGGIIFNNNQNISIDDTLYEILNDNSTKITNMNTSSIGGYLFNLTLDPKYKTLFTSLTSSGYYPINDMILKVVIIDTNAGMFDNHEVVTIDTFNTECEIQTLIHNMSYDKFLESICPTIIGKKHIDHSNSGKLIGNNEVIMLIRNFLRKTTYDIGLIFMEKLNSKPISQLFDQNLLIQNLNSPDLINNIKHVLDNYLYELGRLWRLGYIHGDTHLSNAMYLDNYNYINNERVYLIDFGRSEKHNENILDNDLMDKKICTDMKDWYSYKSLQIYKNTIINTPFGSWFEYMLNLRKESQMSFLKNLKDNHINLLSTIRKYEYNLFDEYKISPNTTFGYYDFNTYTAYLNNIIDEKAFINNNNNKEYTIIKKKIINNKDQLVYSIISGLEENREYYDINITDPTNNTKIDPGIYVWVLYYQDNSLKITFLRTMSYYEIGSKHYCIMIKKQITYYYSAGEMKTTDGINFTFNFMSGTYMMSIGDRDPEYYEKLCQVSSKIIEKLYPNTSFVNDSFIKPDLPIYQKLFDFLESNGVIEELVRTEETVEMEIDEMNGGRISIAPLLNTSNLQKIYDKSNNSTNNKFANLDSMNTKLVDMKVEPKVVDMKVEPKVVDFSFKKTLDYYKTANDVIENRDDPEINKFFIDNFKNDIFRENINQIEKNLILIKKFQFEVLNNNIKYRFNKEYKSNNLTGGLIKNKKKRKTKKNNKINIKKLKIIK